MLGKAVPGERQIIGIDLAQGMVDIANERIGDSSDPALRRTSLDWTSLTPTCDTAAYAISSNYVNPMDDLHVKAISEILLLLAGSG